MSESDGSSAGDWEVGVGNLIIDLDASIDGTKVNNNMNQNGKGNVNLSTNNTDSGATGVKLTDKSDKTSVKDATKDKDLWNQNQNNKHKGKNNNDDDSGKKPSKDLDKKSANGDADKVKEAKSKSKSNASNAGSSSTPTLNTNAGSTPTATQSNGPGSNPRASPGSQSHSANPQQQRETKQNTQTAQNNNASQPNHLTTTGKSKSKNFHKEKNSEKNNSDAAEKKGDGEKLEKSSSKTTSVALANSKQGRRESQDDATAQQKKQDKATKEAGTITEPECLAPCDSGTEVHLSGIIWHESESGMLVVNVTWRNRSYVGTLLDATRHDWAPRRLVGDETDGSNTSNRRRKKNPAENQGGRKTRRSQVPEPGSSPAVTGRKTKRVPTDGDTNSDVENGKSAPKKARTNGRPTTPQNDSETGNSCDSPAPVSGWYNCKFADCQKKFKKLEALQYHIEDHRKKDEDMDVDSETGKKSKSDKKPEKSKQNGKSSSGADQTAVATTAAKDAKEEDSAGKETKNLVQTDAMSVAQSLLDLKNDSKLEKEAGGSSGPPSLSGPPRIEKRVEGGEKAGGSGQPAPMPTLIPSPYSKPPTQSASALPPMPVLTPKPGLLPGLSAPSPGPKRMNPASPIPENTGVSQGKLSPSQNTQNNDIAQSTGSNLTPTGSHEQPPKLERRPTSPFQPVKPDSPNQTANARVSPAYSDISDAGDEVIKPKSDEKDAKKEVDLQSSLNYYHNQYGTYDPHLQPNIINSYNPLLNRDDKKDVVKEEGKTDLKSSQSQEFKPSDKVEPPSPRVSTINANTVGYSKDRPKLNPTESNKPTATIQPEPRKSEPKTPQSVKQTLPTKKEIITSSNSPAPKIPSSQPVVGGPSTGLINYPPLGQYDYRIGYPTPLAAYPTVPYHSVPSIVPVHYPPSIIPPVSAPGYAPSLQPPHGSHMKSHEKSRMDSKSGPHRDNRSVSPSIHSIPKHGQHPMHGIQQAHLQGYPGLLHPSYPSYGLHNQHSTKK